MKQKLKNSLLLICVVGEVAFASELTERTTIAEANRQAYLDSLQQFQQQTHNGQLARAVSTYYYNNDLAVIEALYGKWQISVPVPQPRVDTLQVDSNFVDKNFGYYGWDSKQKVSCFYEPKMFGTIYSYQCLYIIDSANNLSQRYLFNINGNSLTGKYHTGTAADFITKLNANQLVDITGINPAKPADAYYTDTTGLLVLPKVLVNGKNYSVTMQRENNGQFSVKIANPL